ncbi:MAG: polyphosphate polymerase domain-containing protein [Lachnospiraceae bacterium]|nr:polyphosphate polymerase domain-containing protein [Lachnospiraceae bacterium]
MELMARIRDQIVPDEYSDYTISNVYFDTDCSDLIRTSIEKPPYKEKLRLRAYGTPGPEDEVFLEMKKKWDGVVYKRRVELPYRVAQSYLEEEIYPEAYDCQILREIDHMICHYELKPRLFLAYDRLAYVLKEDRTIRFTIDRNIRSRREHICLGDGDDGELLYEDGRKLLEIKAPLALPLWFAQTLAEMKIFPQSFSKYGRIYEDNLAG